MASDQATGTHGPTPIRRLIRIGNPLTRSLDQVAIHLAEQGFSLVPCHYPLPTGDNPVCSCSRSPRKYRLDHDGEAGRKKIGKHPYQELAPHWNDDATNDPDQIRRWLDLVPDLNFGLVTGLSHTVVVDGRERELFLVVIDADSTLAASRLQAEIDMPKTLDVMTGRGLHIYHWTEVPVKGSSRLVGVPDVDVRGVGGYVMAPGSRHYSGAIYTARGRLEDITMASDDLVANHLIPYEETSTGRRQPITSKRADNVIPLSEKLPKLDADDLPADVVKILELDPEVGDRSPVAFRAIRKLLKLTDDDEMIAGTVRSWPVGDRLHEHPLQYTYDEIKRARKYPDTCGGHVARQEKLVENQSEAARPELPFTALKVLHGFQKISLSYEGGKFPAPLAEVVIHAGVEVNTVRKYRDRLIGGGWLANVWQSNGGGKASTYRLKIPSAKLFDQQGATSLHSSPQVLGGLSQMSHPSSGRTSGAISPRPPTTPPNHFPPGRRSATNIAARK
jgi:hypothetical protein